MRRKLFGTRKRVAVTAVAGALAMTGVAVAAFVVLTGVGGSGSGSFDTQVTEQPAMIVQGKTQPVVTPGAPADMDVELINQTDRLETLTALSGAFTSTPPECASHMSVDGSAIVGTQVIAHQSKDAGSGLPPIQIAADATTPTACASGTWSVIFSGTTSP